MTDKRNGKPINGALIELLGVRSKLIVDDKARGGVDMGVVNVERKVEFAETTTNKDGAFIVTAVRRPWAMANISAEGYVTKQVRLDAARAKHIFLDQGLSVYGKVFTYPDQEPISDAEVGCTAGFTGKITFTKTDDEGWYLLQGCSAKRVAMVARHPDYGAAEKS